MKKTNKLAPSLLEADYRFLDVQLKQMELAGADCVHIDVMDGSFVPNFSFSMKMISSIRQSTNLEFDIHMMVQEPHRFSKRMVEAGANILTVHYEACLDVERTLIGIKDLGIKAGIAIKPRTSLDIIDDNLLKIVDVVHLMTVEPGLEGQVFIPQSLPRISDTRKRLDTINPSCDIEVDGNITMENVRDVIDVGANIIVVGKALFTGNMPDNIYRMKQLISL